MRKVLSALRAAPVAVLLLVLASASVAAQNTGSGSTAGSTQSGTTGSSATASTTLQPAPYQPDEFPQWARDLRRAEIITIGVFPFAYLYTNAMYDLGRFLVLTIAGNPNASNYAPWFFAPPTKPGLTDGETVGILVGSIGVAVLVAFLDYAIGKSHRDNASQASGSGP
jgi:hypothetical protein